MSTDISFSDYLAMRNAAFEWAESYDTKDWERLRKCLAPSIRLDFRSLQGPLHEQLSPEEFVTFIVNTIGDKRVKTQHLIGNGKWERLEDGTVHASHQIRVAHQRYEDESLSVVVNKGHGYGVTQHWYRKIEGTWKIEGVEPKLEWSEYDLFGTLKPPNEKEVA